MSERKSDEARRERIRIMKRRQTLLIVTFVLTIILILVVIILANNETKKELNSEKETEVISSSITIEETTTEIVSIEETKETEEETESVTEVETTFEVVEETTLEETTEIETSPSIEESVAFVGPEAPEDYVPQNVQTDRIYIPSWITQDFLTPSQFNRPNEALTEVNNVVIHYVGNPGSSAKGNRDYFEDLSNPQVNPTGHGASSHFVVGLEGEVIQCIPVKEVAFANYPRNYDTVSIEVCHPDAGGKFNDITYGSVVRLSSYLLEELGLTADHLIRHHDVTGKMCPMYYVEHEDAWIQFKEDVRAYMAEHPDIEHEMP